MAMRLLKQNDLELELLKAGLTKTEITTVTARLWICPNGLYVTVPNVGADPIGDYIVDDILNSCGTLYRRPPVN